MLVRKVLRVHARENRDSGTYTPTFITACSAEPIPDATQMLGRESVQGVQSWPAELDPEAM